MTMTKEVRGLAAVPRRQDAKTRVGPERQKRPSTENGANTWALAGENLYLHTAKFRVAKATY